MKSKHEVLIYRTYKPPAPKLIELVEYTYHPDGDIFIYEVYPAGTVRTIVDQRICFSQLPERRFKYDLRQDRQPMEMLVDSSD